MGWAWCLSETESGPLAGGSFPWIPALALFFAVWSIYLGDRLLDARRGLDRPPVPPALLPDRHDWARRHRGLLLSLLVAALAGGSATLPFLDSAVLKSGALTTLATVVYFAVFRFLCRGPGSVPLPFKETAVAACFTAGASIAATSGHPFSIPPQLLAALALLVLGNCLLISSVESDYDRIEDPAAFFAGGRKGRLLPPTILIASLSVALFTGGPGAAPAALVLCTTLTLILAFSRRGTHPSRTQALADGLHLLTYPVAALQGFVS